MNWRISACQFLAYNYFFLYAFFMNTLEKPDIAKEYQPFIATQNYAPKPKIEGVILKEIRNMTSEDGDFSEILRIDEKGDIEGFEGFRIRQINRSKMLPGNIKAWHLHYKQDEIQTVNPEDHLIVGLWDVREDSKTKGISVKYILGGGKAHLLYIPKGVAHGYTNVSKKAATILYFVSEQFSLENPDEQRLPWDSLGKEFWETQKE